MNTDTSLFTIKEERVRHFFEEMCAEASNTPDGTTRRLKFDEISKLYDDYVLFSASSGAERTNDLINDVSANNGSIGNKNDGVKNSST